MLLLAISRGSINQPIISALVSDAVSHPHQFGVMESHLPPLIFNVLSVADVAQTAKLPQLTFPRRHVTRLEQRVR